MSADPTAILKRLEGMEQDAQKSGALFDRSEVLWLCQQLRSALQDTQRLNALQAAIEDDRLYVDANSLPAISLYPLGSDEAIVEHSLRDAADRVMASTREARPAVGDATLCATCGRPRSAHYTSTQMPGYWCDANRLLYLFTPVSAEARP